MKWLKDRLFNYKLKSRLSSLPAANQEVQQNRVKSIGILFDESHFPSEKDLHHYINQWIAKGKQVETFSFVDVKELEENTDSEKKYCKKDVNWFQVPQGDKIEAFIAKPFDILITLNPSKKRHLHFLNASSSARFKIGLLPDELDFYNLILDVDESTSIKKVFTDIQQTLDKLTI